MGTVVTVPSAMVAPLPTNLTFQEAATTPTVFITGKPPCVCSCKGLRLLLMIGAAARLICAAHAIAAFPMRPCTQFFVSIRQRTRLVFGNQPTALLLGSLRCYATDMATPPAALSPAVGMALHHVSGMKAADRVLVHGAAGGVGLAAMQIIAAVGATAVMTAGSPAKRAMLHSLGVQHVLGSRDTEFAAGLAQLGGASVVLNSLTSAGMVAGSLAALSLGARFVEISKRDIWSAARMAQGERGGMR